VHSADLFKIAVLHLLTRRHALPREVCRVVWIEADDMMWFYVRGDPR
jgi:hypothetical protein